jgi:hypothetical protein
MNSVFPLSNRASADEIRTRLTNSPSDSAVRVMLTRLEKKGNLKHQYDGPRYVYSATHGITRRCEADGPPATFADLLRRLAAPDDDGSCFRRFVDRPREAVRFAGLNRRSAWKTWLPLQLTLVKR